MVVDALSEAAFHQMLSPEMIAFGKYAGGAAARQINPILFNVAIDAAACLASRTA